MSAEKRKRTIVAGVVLVVCIALLIAMFTGRCSSSDEALKAREQLGWYSVLIGEGEYSDDTVPTVYTTIGRRTLTDYYTTSGAGKYWSVYSYSSETGDDDIAAYTSALVENEGFVRSEAASDSIWLERDYENGIVTVVTIYMNDTGYDVWVGSQQGRRG